ncbi:MAG: hypothetical protein EPN88_03370 [Bacteroidetes bacterium]|nr:MAG: hypothetical protein EPN88_03370 [Bacteroidota bacterium]
MKKLLFVMLFVMGAVVANAQKTPVKTADLNKAITDNIAKDYAGFTIKEATQVVENNVVTFDVVVTKGTTQETLCYDKDGKFMKKMAVKAGTVEKKEAKPAAPAKKAATPPAKKK